MTEKKVTQVTHQFSFYEDGRPRIMPRIIGGRLVHDGIFFDEDGNMTEIKGRGFE